MEEQSQSTMLMGIGIGALLTLAFVGITFFFCIQKSEKITTGRTHSSVQVPEERQSNVLWPEDHEEGDHTPPYLGWEYLCTPAASQEEDQSAVFSQEDSAL